MKAEGFPVEAACRAAEVSTSAYYGWSAKEAAGPSDKELEDACVVAEMRAVHEELDATYGSPRMTRELSRRGFRVNHKRTERLMAENGIVAVTPRRSVGAPRDDRAGQDLGAAGDGGELGRDVAHLGSLCRSEAHAEA